MVLRGQRTVRFEFFKREEGQGVFVMCAASQAGDGAWEWCERSAGRGTDEVWSRRRQVRRADQWYSIF